MRREALPCNKGVRSLRCKCLSVHVKICNHALKDVGRSCASEIPKQKIGHTQKGTTLEPLGV